MIETPDAIRQRLSERLFGRPIMQNQFRSTYVEAMLEPYLGSTGWRYVGADWNGWDFERDGMRLEVKQSAVVQNWSFRRGKLTKPVFSIAPTSGYYINDGADWVAEPGRAADLFVFAWHGVEPEKPLAAGDPYPVDHRDPSQWAFYVALEAKLPSTKTISLEKIGRLGEQRPVGIVSLPSTVEIVLSSPLIER